MLGVSTPAWCSARRRRRSPDSSNRVTDAARGGSIRRALGTRDQVRWLSHAGAPAKGAACHVHAEGPRLDAALSADRRSGCSGREGRDVTSGGVGPADYCAAAGGHHRCGVDIGEARQPLYGAKLTAATTRLSSSFDTSSGQASRRGVRDSPLRTIENLETRASVWSRASSRPGPWPRARYGPSYR
jgi:hypothetical protein